MDIQQILTADYLDILFDNRNKSYGGYQLRRHYARRTMKALGSVVLSVALLAAYPTIANALKHEVPVADPYFNTIITISDVKPPIADPVNIPPTPPAGGGAPKTHFKTVSATPPEVVPDDVATNLLKPVDEIKNAVISTEDHPGDLTANDAGLVVAGDGGDGNLLNGKGGKGLVEGPKKDNGPLVFVDQMPEFNGNITQYLQDHMRYPQAAIDEGIEGRVMVRFVVSEDGSISLAEIIKGIGGGCNEEALRVVKGMPRWKPGKQNGQPVKVYFTLPITFRYM